MSSYKYRVEMSELCMIFMLMVQLVAWRFSTAIHCYWSADIDIDNTMCSVVEKSWYVITAG